MPSSTTDLDRIKGWLASVRFCHGLDAEQIEAIAGDFSIRPFEAGETVASAGDPVTEFWILAEGEFDSFLTDARGREKPLGIVRQGETVGEVMILEKTPTRPIRFTARTHGTLLVAPAECLQKWIKSYPQMMQNLFFTLSDRFKVVAGAASRHLPSPRLGIVASSPRGFVLTGRLVSKLASSGERLRIWACDPTNLTSPGSWPNTLPILELPSGESPLQEPPSADVDRQIVVWSPSSDTGLNFKAFLGCDEILWLLEPNDTDNLLRYLRLLKASPESLQIKFVSCGC